MFKERYPVFSKRRGCITNEGTFRDHEESHRIAINDHEIITSPALPDKVKEIAGNSPQGGGTIKKGLSIMRQFQGWAVF